jgi:hypothetical protein
VREEGARGEWREQLLQWVEGKVGLRFGLELGVRLGPTLTLTPPSVSVSGGVVITAERSDSASRMSEREKSLPP